MSLSQNTKQKNLLINNTYHHSLSCCNHLDCCWASSHTQCCPDHASNEHPAHIILYKGIYVCQQKTAIHYYAFLLPFRAQGTIFGYLNKNGGKVIEPWGGNVPHNSFSSGSPEELKFILADIGQKAIYTLDWSPVNHGIRDRDSPPFTLPPSRPSTQVACSNVFIPSLKSSSHRSHQEWTWWMTCTLQTHYAYEIILHEQPLF